jgi:hypothetical protein
MADFLSASSILKSRGPTSSERERNLTEKPHTHFLSPDSSLSAVTIYKAFFDGLRLHPAL